ncbi:helix-turn-helix domain-containing protein [Ensifer sp.]|uniref:AraC family transcriptional regulator n=1 Tax=Ensifer sp. TaxID=1872086 RepID=UPI002897014D|nr:helix-turn-helix domain-containing protein [Ensifer sp.]
MYRHRLFSTTDLDEGEEFASQIWEENHSTISDGRYGLRWNEAVGDKIKLSYVELDCAVELKAQGPLSDHFRTFFHQKGRIDHGVNGRAFTSDPTTAAVHCPGMDLSMHIKPFELLLLSLDGRSVRNAMAQRFRKLPDYVDWLGGLRPSHNLASLRSLTAWLAKEIENESSPLVQLGKPRLHAERLLLSLFVECVAESAPLESEAVCEGSQVQAERAREWIDANLSEVFGVEEIAAAAGVGVRSLQKSFKRLYGCSPHAYATRRRLESVRQLLLSDSESQTVTSAATQLGFFELGRFAQSYRRHFGETPSATLMRRS